MFEKLKEKWKVGTTDLILILIVFAITGTTTAYLTRQITIWLELERESLYYWLIKIAILLVGYQLLILLVALPFGQFAFFWNFLKKMWKRIL